MLSYTFHPFVIGRGQRMLLLEKLLKTLERWQRRILQDGSGRPAYDKKLPLGQKSK